jgi:serine/threonine-protein kinase
VIDIGSVVNGKYRLVRILGDGGMGSVYEALHVALGTRVAVKVLHPELARRTGLVERFLQEARVAAQIRSPYVVQVTDVDRTPEGYAYIVMELLEGEPLSSVLDRQRKLSVTIACAYATQILQALEAAHALGVIHRDLKPENVFVTFAGGRPVLKLIDFGIAKARPEGAEQKRLTVAGVVMGTAEYMAPEQARSADAVDARADIYAVGVMLYEMLAGARPVGGADARIIALKVERGEVIPLLQVAPDAPREIAGLVHRAMAARPELRFPTATEMRLAIEAAASGRRMPTAGMTAARATGSGSGTMELATRRDGPASSPGAVPPGTEGAPVTIRAPPLATALAPAAVSPGLGAPAVVPAHSAVGGAPRAPLRRGLLAVIVLLLLVLGGVLAAVVVNALDLRPGSAAMAAGDSTSTPAARSPGKSVSAGLTDEPAASARPAALPSLVPTRPSPGPTPAPARPPVRPVATAIDAGTAGPPPVFFPPVLPSTLPPFPSGFSLPPGFPTALPSAFPTALPSGFPTALPAWPPAPAPAQPAAPVPAASSSGGVY